MEIRLNIHYYHLSLKKRTHSAMLLRGIFLAYQYKQKKTNFIQKARQIMVKMQIYGKNKKFKLVKRSIIG
jgi:hypothetical protein